MVSGPGYKLPPFGSFGPNRLAVSAREVFAGSPSKGFSIHGWAAGGTAQQILDPEEHVNPVVREHHCCPVTMPLLHKHQLRFSGKHRRRDLSVNRLHDLGSLTSAVAADGFRRAD